MKTELVLLCAALAAGAAFTAAPAAGGEAVPSPGEELLGPASLPVPKPLGLGELQWKLPKGVRREGDRIFASLAPGEEGEEARSAALAIRSVDPDATIIVAANGYGHPGGFRTLSPLRLDNVVYTTHCYAPTAFTMQGLRGGKREGLARWPDPEKGWDKDCIRKALEPVLAFSKEHDARILVGEFSAITWAPGADAYIRDCIEVFEEYGWDWCYHAFREWDGWSVEKTWVEYDPATMSDRYEPSDDNPRKRALLDGFAGRLSPSATPD